MTKLKLRLLAVGILVLGVVLALPFRQMADGLPAPSENSEPDLDLKQVNAEHVVRPLPATPSAPLATDLEQTNSAPAEPAVLAPHLTASARNDDQAARAADVPAMAKQYQPALQPMIPPRPLTRDEKPRQHRLVDGDSVPGLAARYLGSPHRYQEILQANPGLNPHLLPLGRRIVIPPKRPRRPTPAAKVETNLVPID